MVFAVALFIPAAFATDSCETALHVERTADGAFFDRNALAPGVPHGPILERLIEEVEPGRPVIIYDTNPAPARWFERNIVTAADDLRLAGAPYDELGGDLRASLFAGFLERADRTSRESARAVLLIDHHFESNVLLTASSTPLTLDFLAWLDAQPAGEARDRVRAAFARGFALRDHADADIVLANFVGRLAEDPAARARFGPLARDVALFNDHATLPSNAGGAARAAAIVGHALLEAFEHHVAPRPGGFQKTLDAVPRVLDLVGATAGDLAESNDPVGAFLAHPRAAELSDLGVLERVREDWVRRRDLRTTFVDMLVRGQGVRRIDDVLVVELPTMPEAASGMSILRFVHESDHPITAGARALILITREPGDGEAEVTHVKIRALAPGVNLDRLVTAILTRGQGGGGRGRACGLYGPAGRVLSAEDLARDLTWAIDHITPAAE